MVTDVPVDRRVARLAGRTPPPAPIPVMVGSPKRHGFREKRALVVEVNLRSDFRQRHQIHIHTKHWPHHVKVAGRHHRPVRQTRILEPIAAAPAAIVRVLVLPIAAIHGKD